MQHHIAERIYGPIQEIHMGFMVQGVCPACGDAVLCSEKYRIVRWPTSNFLMAVHDGCMEA